MTQIHTFIDDFSLQMLALVPVLLYKNQAGKAAETASGPNHYARILHHG